MSFQNNKGRFSTTKLGQWFKATPLVPLTDAECYEMLYGDMIRWVPHYMQIRIDTRPGSFNIVPRHQLKYVHLQIVNDYDDILNEIDRRDNEPT